MKEKNVVETTTIEEVVQATALVQKNQRKKRRLRLFGGAAAVVVFITTYMLILPAITLEHTAVCGLEEHTHTEACYTITQELTCGLEEAAGHTHTDACYSTSAYLACGLTEGEEHTHTDACYAYEQVLSCGQQELAAHSHSADCYTSHSELSCTIAEHTHTDDCFAKENKTSSAQESADDAEAEDSSEVYGDTSADIESAADWEATMRAVELTGNWAEDILAIADSQLGYHESTANTFTYTDETGARVTKGYSRYGAWYGSPYGDWCAMFCSFCLNYAEIPQKAFPQHSGCPAWITLLIQDGLYESAISGYVPKAGDLIFYDWEQDDDCDHVGLVYELQVKEDGTTFVKTIEGNCNDQVQYSGYNLNDPRILGYGVLPENPDYVDPNAVEEETEAASENTEPVTLTATAGSYEVTAVYTPEAGLPDGTELRVSEIDPTSDHFAQRAEEYQAETGKTMDFLLDICFYADGVEVEPAAPVTVTIRFLQPDMLETEDAAIVHFGEDGTEALESTPVSESAETSFSMSSFSEVGGSTGDDSATGIAWSFDEDTGVLTISGTGSIPNYSVNQSNGSYVSTAPWNGVLSAIKSVVISDGVTGIGDAAFGGCINLTTVSIPASVTDIGARAFYSCKSLTTVSIPTGVAAIAASTFASCSALKEISIPNTVTSIGAGAFSSCSALKEISLPNTVTSIGAGAFASCSVLEAVNIPAGVTAIAASTFAGCSALKEISIPNTVTSIGAGAFSSCIALTAVSIPNTVTSIGDGAFASCRALTAVSIPNTVTSIGAGAFSSCIALTAVSIPDTVTSIGANAFGGCSALEVVNIPAGVTAIAGSTFGGCSALKKISIPNTVSSIGAGAFSGCSALEAVNIPAGVTAIADSTFGGCSALKEISIPNTVTSIGASAFGGCSALTSIQDLSNVTSIGAYAFSGCTALTSIQDLSSVTSIGTNAFAGVPAEATAGLLDENGFLIIDGTLLGYYGTATELTIPDNVRIIAEKVFYNNRSITKVVTSNGLESIGASAFYGCTSLTEVALPASLASIGTSAFYGCTSLTEVPLPASLASIGVYAFRGCISLTEVALPAGLKSTGSYAFYGCTSLTEVEFPDGLESIDGYAFYGCTSLTEVALPAGLKSIGNSAMSGCISLAEVVIPDSLESIGSSAFYGCTALAEVVIPDSITSLPFGVFYNCTKLKSLVLGAGITSITGYAFNNVTLDVLTLRSTENLTKIIASLPEASTSGGTVMLDSTVSELTAAQWTSLKNKGYSKVGCIGPVAKITIPAVTWADGTQVAAGTYGVDENGKLYVLKTCGSAVYWELKDGVLHIFGTGTMTNYSSSSFPWYSMRDQITSVVIDKGVTSVGNYAFWKCSNISAVSLPESVTRIGECAFGLCTSLSSVTIPNGVTQIGSYAFYECDKLTDVTIGNNLNSISDHAFYHCDALAKVEFGNSVTTIGNYAFTNCSALTEIEIPDSVTTIGADAFAQCSALAKVELGNSVQTIGIYAFMNCSALTSIELGNSVQTIGGSAFMNCSALTEIEIPDSVRRINNHAFSGCSSLTAIELGNSLELIEEGGFYQCSALTEIKIPDSVRTIGKDAFGECSSLTAIELGNSVTTIGEDAFIACNNLETIRIPASVTSFGPSAFYLTRDNLTAVYFDGTASQWRKITRGNTSSDPVGANTMLYVKNEAGDYVEFSYESTDLTGMTEIPDYYFANYGSLTEITIPDTVTRIGKYAFSNCTNLKTIHGGSGLETIDDYAFYNCDALTEIELPGTVKIIGNYAFYDCSALETIEIPDSVTTIGNGAFNNCDALTAIEVPDSVTTIGQYAFSGCDKLAEVTLGNGLTTIPYRAFWCSKGLAAIKIPDSVTTIGREAFDGCDALTAIEIPDSVTTIGSYAFAYCNKLTDVTIGNGLTSIPEYAFTGCSALTTIEIPGTVKSIETCAFERCKKLCTVKLSEGLESIGQSAFSQCSLANGLKIPDSVTTIDANAFYGSSPYCVELGKGLTTLNSTAFNSATISELTINCSDLTSIVGTGNFPSDTNNVRTIVIGPNVDTLSSSTWNYFNKAGYARIFFKGPNVLSLPAMELPGYGTLAAGTYYANEYGALYRLDAATNQAELVYVPSNLTDYTIPATITADGVIYTVTGICSNALKAASDLAALTIADTSKITNVADYAFAYASKLTSVNGKSNETDIRALFGANCNIGNNILEGTLLGGVYSSVTESNRTKESITVDYKYNIEKDQSDLLRVTLSQRAESIASRYNTTNDNIFEYLTGRGCSMNMTISNSANMSDAGADVVVRTYIAMVGDEGAFSLSEGAHTVTTSDGGKAIPYTVVKVTDKLYYIEVKAQDTNHVTAEISFAMNFPNGSAGGTARVWTVIDTAEALNSAAAGPDTAFQQMNWITLPNDYYVEKTRSGTMKFLVDQSTERAYANTNAWYYYITPKTTAGTGSSYGQDVVTTICYKDTMTLPEGMIWDPELLSAVKAGNWNATQTSASAFRIYVQLSGEPDKKICDLTGDSNAYLVASDAALQVVTDENGKETIQITWVDENLYAYTTDPEKRIKTGNGRKWTLNLGEKLCYLDADPAEVTVGATYTVKNTADMEWNYRYSEKDSAQASISGELKFTNHNLSFKKSCTKYASYFGDDITYQLTITNGGNMPYIYGDRVEDNLPTDLYITASNMYKMLTDESFGKDLRIAITDANFELNFESESVSAFTGSANLAVSTNPQTSGTNPTYGSGTATDWSAATGDGVLFVNEDTANYTTGTLQLYWSDGILYLQQNDGVPVAVNSAAALETQLNAMGYFVGPKTRYNLTWKPVDTVEPPAEASDDIQAETEEAKTWFTVPGDTEYKFYVYATVKDTFMHLSQDHLHEYSGSNAVCISNRAFFYTKDKTGGYTADRSDYVSKEFYLYKTAQDTNGNMIVQAGDGAEILYTLTLRSYSSKNYSVLPWTDCIKGAQVLLAPAAKNTSLANSGLETYTSSNGTLYYKLQPGTYSNINVGSFTAASITVTAIPGGYRTLIKWYGSGTYYSTPEKYSYTTKTHTYRVLVDSVLAGSYSENAGFALDNVTWLGDHQGQRIFAPWGISGHNMYHDKYIVVGQNEDGEDELEKYTILHDGDSVTYRLDIRNIGKDDYTVTGADIYDELPLSLKGETWKYLWETGTNVSVSYGGNYENAADSVKSGGDSWYVDEGEAAGPNGAWQQNLRWDNNFKVVIPKGDNTFYIYVTLKYPSNSGTEDIWSRYCEMNAGNQVSNKFHILDMLDVVYHDLGEAPQVLLQKGVVSTSFSGSRTPEKETAETALYQFENYDAGGMSNAVTFYAVVYNDGNSRLYLETLEDILPDGWIPQTYSSNKPIISVSTDGTIANISSASGKTPEYLRSNVTATWDAEHLYIDLQPIDDHYSEENEHYYLLPGEAILLTYKAYPGSAAQTGDFGTNRIAMSYYNFYNLPITVSEAAITGCGTGALKGGTENTYTANDGACDVITSVDAANRGYKTKTTNLQWLESEVTLARKKVIPGIQKVAYSARSSTGMVTAYPKTVHAGDQVTWKVSAMNSGDALITGYTLTDTIPAGNRFVGDIKLTSKSKLDAASPTETTLVTLSNWSADGKTVKVVGSCINATLTVNGAEVTGYLLSNEVEYNKFSLGIKTDAEGNMILTMTFDWLMIYPQESSDFYITTEQAGDVRYGSIENTASLSIIQSYDPLDVVYDDRTDDSDTTVTWSDNVWMLSDHMTYPEIQVTETADTTNYGIGSTPQNHIILPKRDSSFFYTLTVNNTTNYSMEKLVIIDNLPEVDDGDTYNASSKRDSAFKVVLDPEKTGFVVKVTDENGNVTTLDSSKYTIEFSTLTNFPAGTTDWNGDANEHWTAQSGWASYAAANKLTYDDIRSIRVVINDTAEEDLIPKNSVVTVDFFALVDEPFAKDEDGSYIVPDAKIAWTTFGYYYTLDKQTLFAGSRKVGVEIPSVPELYKNFKLGADDYPLQQADTFTFVIYEGTAIDSMLWNPDDLRGTLGDKKFTIVTMSANAGDVNAGTKRLDDCKVYSFDESGKPIATEKDFVWKTDSVYTVAELMTDAQSDLFTVSWSGAANESGSFQNSGQRIDCTNNVRTYDLPKTGGAGTKWFTIAGLALMALAFVMGFSKRRRREGRAAD